MGTDGETRHGDGGRVGCDCKVGTVSGRYGLGDVSTELEVLWTAEGSDRYSLRDLADYFNQRVLKSAMVGAGMNPLEGEVENVYRLLTDDDSGTGPRVQAERRLERESLSVEDLRDDFVTHQTVYRHLKNCLQAEYQRESDPDTRLERNVRQIESFRNRIRIVVEEMVRRLRDADLFSIADPSVYVDVRILCEECGSFYSPRDLLEEDGCECN